MADLMACVACGTIQAIPKGKVEADQRNWPFKIGDTIESITDDHTTAKRGRRFKVTSCYNSSKGWRVRVAHPYGRFNNTSYYARKFKLVETDENQEKIFMYIALDAGNVKPEHLDPNSIRGSNILVMDTTMDRGFKTYVEEYLKRNPEARVLVFTLDKIVEVDAPPVLWRNMR